MLSKCDATAHHLIFFIMLLSHLVSRFIYVLLDCYLHIRFGHCHHIPSSSSISTLQNLVGWYGCLTLPTFRTRHQSNESTPSRTLLVEWIPQSLDLHSC
jgi:hypothetical protein